MNFYLARSMLAVAKYSQTIELTYQGICMLYMVEKLPAAVPLLSLKPTLTLRALYCLLYSAVLLSCMGFI